jgi:hypothetical protein
MRVTRLITAACLGVGAAALIAGAALGATTTTAAPAAAAPAAKAAGPKVLAPARKSATPPAAKSTVDAEALAAMSRMAAYLRTLNSFQVVTATERDEVDDFGQVLTFGGETTYKVKSPDAFVISVVEDRKARDYTYDGKSLTIFAPRMDFYAKVAAPPTIRQTLDAAATKYGVTVPLDDLFAWDRGDTDHSAITSAHVVGPARIAGQDTIQYAFRQPGIDWQIWIATGDKPLPLKVVIVASNDPDRPQFEADLKWDTAARFTADTFAFTPPADARLIAIQSDGQ